jgi:serine/threonine protein kinase
MASRETIPAGGAARTGLGALLRGRAAARELGAPGSYQWGRRLDQGDGNEVHEASYPGVPGRFAIKLFRRAVGAGRPASEAFQREATLVGSLRHPHCVQVFQVGARADGVPFVVMEHLRGQTLRELLAGRASVAPAQAAAWIKAVASALAAAHDSNVIHGELRPAQVFLAEVAGYERGFVKLLDFGAWRLGGDGGPAALDIEAARYGAPEVASARIEQVDARSDQFALAAIAYRLLSGSDAFPGTDVVSVLYRLLHDEPRPLTDLVRCDPMVDTVLRRALAKDPGQRFATVLGFAEALEDAVASGPAAFPQTMSESLYVSESQVVAATPLANAAHVGARVMAVQDEDEVSQAFFAEGDNHPSGGWQAEPEPYVGSLDRVPRRWWPIALALLALLGVGTAVAWRAGWRPPSSWQQSRLWQTLHLPAIQPAGAPAPAPAP